MESLFIFISSSKKTAEYDILTLLQLYKAWIASAAIPIQAFKKSKYKLLFVQRQLQLAPLSLKSFTVIEREDRSHAWMEVWIL